MPASPPRLRPYLRQRARHSLFLLAFLNALAGLSTLTVPRVGVALLVLAGFLGWSGLVFVERSHAYSPRVRRLAFAALVALPSIAFGALLGWSLGVAHEAAGRLALSTEPILLPAAEPVTKPFTGTNCGFRDLGLGRTTPVETPPELDEPWVWVTPKGTKYHRASCTFGARYRGSHPIPLSQAVGRYTPCSRCDPPVPGLPSSP
jgi:hypothetical protein